MDDNNKVLETLDEFDSKTSPKDCGTLLPFVLDIILLYYFPFFFLFSLENEEEFDPFIFEFRFLPSVNNFNDDIILLFFFNCMFYVDLLFADSNRYALLCAYLMPTLAWLEKHQDQAIASKAQEMIKKLESSSISFHL